MPQVWPNLITEQFPQSRAGLHAWAKLLGVYASALAPRRRHWWHISLKPAVNGFRTGVLNGNGRLLELTLSFNPLEIELNVAGEGPQGWSLQGEFAQSMRRQLGDALANYDITLDLDESRIDPSCHAIDPGSAATLGQVYGQLGLWQEAWAATASSKSEKL